MNNLEIILSYFKNKGVSPSEIQLLIGLFLDKKFSGKNGSLYAYIQYTDNLKYDSDINIPNHLLEALRFGILYRLYMKMQHLQIANYYKQLYSEAISRYRTPSQFEYIERTEWNTDYE